MRREALNPVANLVFRKPRVRLLAPEPARPGLFSGIITASQLTALLSA